MREIERKFLVAGMPSGLDKCTRHEIAQGYLAVDPRGAVVRLRRSNEERCLTVKQGHGLEREEHNVPLEHMEFEALWQLTGGRRLRKTRYDIEHEEWTIELDVFHGANAGLVVAEVEFPDIDHSKRFQPPEWFGEEVTGNARYSNSALAKD